MRFDVRKSRVAVWIMVLSGGLFLIIFAIEKLFPAVAPDLHQYITMPGALLVLVAFASFIVALRLKSNSIEQETTNNSEFAELPGDPAVLMNRGFFQLGEGPQRSPEIVRGLNLDPRSAANGTAVIDALGKLEEKGRVLPAGGGDWCRASQFAGLASSMNCK